MQPDVWYCLEIMLDGGTPTPTQAGANGIQNFWVDGVEIGPWTDLWHRTTATGMDVNLFSLALYLPNPHDPGIGLRYDNVVVSTNQIGCVGTVVSAPGPPTNLRIVS
jgi:hypothetical protein